MKSKLIITGIFFALLGIVLNGVYQNNKYDREEYESKHTYRVPEELSGKFTLKIGDKEFSYQRKGKDKDQENKPVSLPENGPRDLKIFRLLGLVCGVLALGCAIFYFSLKGNPRVSAAIVGAGLICIAWEYVLYAVGVAVVIVILSVFG
jgi:hypothetical protein